MAESRLEGVTVTEHKIETFEDADASRVWRRGGTAASQNAMNDPDQDADPQGDNDTTDADTTDTTDSTDS